MISRIFEKILSLSITYLIISFWCISCASTKKNSTEGLLLNQSGFLDHNTKKYIPDQIGGEHKVWYQDSIVIEESGRTDIRNDSNGQRFISTVDHYIYIDLKTRSFYEYKTFSDTTKILKKYTQSDSININLGWSFFKYHNVIPRENMKVLADTIINNISYKRTESVHVVQDIRRGPVAQSIVAYMRCDKKNSIFHYDRALDEQIGCPVTRFEMRDKGAITSAVFEMEFVRDILTPEELKVFAAWKRNAKLNPVK